MKKKIIGILFIILISILLILIYRYVENSILINGYNKNNYKENIAKTLTFINISEPYIAHYNYGNVLYKNEKYNEAIVEYKKALNSNVPKEKKYRIRINYALSICKTVELNEKDVESIKKAIGKYESAIKVLTNESYNDKEETNKNEEQLKQDIQEEIDRLKKLIDYNSNEEKKQDDEKDKEENEEEKKIEKKLKNEIEKIKKIKEDAIQYQKEKENEFKFLNSDFINNWGEGEKNW